MTKLGRIGFQMVLSSYDNLWKTMAASCVTWTAGRLITRLGLDATTTTTFTAMASAIYYFSKPFFNKCDEEDLISLANRLITMVYLTKVSADALKLDLPFIMPFAKTAAVAAGIIALLDIGPNFLNGIYRKRNERQVHFHHSESPSNSF